MNFKPAFALIFPLLCAALPATVFAQSGMIHFQGRIVAPVCSGTLSAEQSPPDSVGGQVPVFSMDNTGCEHNAGGMVANIRVSEHERPQATLSSADTRAKSDGSDPVWTITYH